MKYSNSIAITLLLLLGIVGCKKDSVVEPEPSTNTGLPIHTVTDLLADGLGVNRFTYFRLSDSSIVPFTDSNSTKWDIAFRSTTIRINGGSSGPGCGGLIRLTGQDFNALTSAPAAGYAVDSLSGPALKTGSGNGWYNYNSTTNIITPLADVVLAIKTGTGRYAKVQILNYYKGAPANLDTTSISRNYKFRYVYQPDSTLNFK